MLHLLKANLRAFEGATPGDVHQYNLNTNTTGTTTLSAEMKTYYDTALIHAAEPKLVHEQFGQKRNIPQGRGRTIEFRKFSQLPKALTPLTEGVIRTAARSRSSATPRRSASTAITSRFPIFSKRLRSTPFCRKRFRRWARRPDARSIRSFVRF